MYSSVQLARNLSGFQDTTKIPSSRVRNKILMADSLIDGVIGDQYVLPLPYHRENTLTFSGNGSGSGVMGVVINSVTYNVSIESSLTSEQAADRFREAAANSSDFKTDEVGSGEEVRIVSITDSTNASTANAEVNITLAPTTQGVSAVIGTRKNAYPPAIQQLSAEIAAAQLLMDEYGIEAQDSSKDGVQRYDRYERILSFYQDSEETPLSMRLRDEITGNELPTANENAVLGYPNNTSELASDSDTHSPTASKLQINKKF